MGNRPLGYQRTDERKIKPGHVITVWSDLDAITAPEVIRSPTVVGARMMAVGNGKESALGFKMASWSGTKNTPTR